MMEEKHYLNRYGSLSHCWRVHRELMQSKELPRVTYSTFRHRVRALDWNLYRAIHTPADIDKRDKDRRKKVRVQNFRESIKDFFR